jgi:hypothetical protein
MRCLETPPTCSRLIDLKGNTSHVASKVTWLHKSRDFTNTRQNKPTTHVKSQKNIKHHNIIHIHTQIPASLIPELSEKKRQTDRPKVCHNGTSTAMLTFSCSRNTNISFLCESNVSSHILPICRLATLQARASRTYIHTHIHTHKHT